MAMIGSKKHGERQKEREIPKFEIEQTFREAA
jgi:hypothetical protein